MKYAVTFAGMFFVLFATTFGVAFLGATKITDIDGGFLAWMLAIWVAGVAVAMLVGWMLFWLGMTPEQRIAYRQSRGEHEDVKPA
jgi:high-affinity Fe2+/Pb2+ permease